MNPILVIGATGTVGRQVVSQLIAAGSPVRAMTRNPDAAKLPPQVQIVRGDLTVPETLDACLDNTDAVFLVWTALPSAVAPALQRITQRARRIVYLSAPLKTPHPLFQQPNLLRSMFEQIERTVETSGAPWTFLRPGMFAANALLWWAPQIRAGNIVRWPYLAVPTAPIDERDIAAVAVRALREEGHAGAEYVLTGPQSLTHSEQISTIAKVLGRDRVSKKSLPAKRAANSSPSARSPPSTCSSMPGPPPSATPPTSHPSSRKSLAHPQNPFAPGSPTTSPPFAREAKGQSHRAERPRPVVPCRAI